MTPSLREHLTPSYHAVPATVSNSTNFSASVPLPSGTNIISVTAQPTSGPIATQGYQIVTTGIAPTLLTYDANGNILTDENGNSYLWDALNRLVRITYPGTGPQKLSGTIIGTSGSNGNSGNVIANAFDGNASTYFDGPTADGCWLGLDLGVNHPAVTQIKYTCRAGYGSRMVGGQFQISSASDFSSGVVTLATITTAPSDGVSVAVPIVGATEERYVRYLSPSGSYGDIAELEFDSSSCSEFAYDGLSRRVQIIEQNATGGITSTKNYLWIGQEIAEERSSSNSVTKRFFPQGEQQSSYPYYYTRDHLGSVRELISSTGTIFARYSYSDYGVRTYVQGSGSANFQYAGMYLHAASGLNLTRFRAYDPNSGRWLSRDPIAEKGGIDLYGYVLNDPIDYFDPLGLTHRCFKRLLITEFNDATGTHDNTLGPGDAASGVPGYTPSDFDANGNVLPGHVIHKKGVYPTGTRMTIYPGPKTVTINDSGAGYAESRRKLGIPDGVPVDSWIDVWTKDGNGNPVWMWVAITLKDGCQCPAGWADNPRAQPVQPAHH